MLIFRILFFDSILVAVWTSIPLKDLQFQTIDPQMGSYESKVRESLLEAKNFFETSTGHILTEASTFVPTVGPMLERILTHIGIFFSSNSQWTSAFLEHISEQWKRDIIQSEIGNLESSMITIKRNLLEFRYDTAEIQRTWAIVQSIRDNLDTIVNKFGLENSKFREYPMQSVPSLIALTSLAVVYQPIDAILMPSSTDKYSDTVCKLHHTLLEYRSATVLRRLYENDIYVKRWYEVDKEDFLRNRHIHIIMNRPFDQHGYNREHSTIDCEEFTDVPNYTKQNLKDNMGKNVYYSNRDRNKVDKCILGYMGHVRHRVEMLFNESVSYTHTICSYKSRQSYVPSGNGWLTINLQEVFWMTDSNGDSCDNNDYDCDLYVKMSIDGRRVFTTPVKISKEYPKLKEPASFYYIFKSGKISKTSKLTFEIWDEDGGLNGGDDKLETWNTNVNALLANEYHRNGNNFMKISSSWKNEEDGVGL